MRSLKNKNRKINLLVVDSDLSVLAAFSTSLLNTHYQVTTAESIEEAEALLTSATYKFDVAIIDHAIPGHKDLSLITRLSVLEKIPFIMFSANQDSDYVDEANRLGAMSYLVKPLEINQAIPQIEAAIVRGNEIQRLRDEKEQLQKAIISEREVNVAIGLTMAQLKLPRKESFEYLRLTARNRRIKLSVVAIEIIQSTEMTLKN